MVRTYDPKQVSYIAAGAIISGFADGTFLNVARNEETVSFQRAAQGGGTRTITSDKSGRITATLQQTSPSNAVFASQQAILELQGGSADLFTALVKDTGGLDLHSAATAWVVVPAESEYANALSNREWIVETDELVMAPNGQST